MGINLIYGPDLETTESSKLFKYSVVDFSELGSLQNIEIGDLSYVQQSTGIKYINQKIKGLYEYDGSNWNYASQDLQDQAIELLAEIEANEAQIQSNDAEILALQTANTGDETTQSIQSKRPLKTINGESLEGTGDIVISGGGGGGTPTGGFTGTSEDLNLRITDLENINEELGTIQFRDTQYNTGNRLQGTANQDLIIPNNKGNIFNVSAPASAVNWITNNKLTFPNGNGDTYIARLDFSYRVTQNNRNAILSIDIGGSQGKIFNASKTLGRVANQDTSESISLPFYVAQTFFQNGGDLKLQVNGSFQIWDMSIVLIKINVADDNGVSPPTSFGTASINVTNSFNGGFVFDLIIENTSASDVSGWIVTLSGTNITQITSGGQLIITNTGGNDYTLENVSFNGTIQAGQTRTVTGLNGSTGDPNNVNFPTIQNITVEEV